MSTDFSSESQPVSVMGAEFKYEPLEFAAKEIRLVDIIRKTSQLLEVRLSTHEIIDAPEYNAISYTWGDGENTSMTDIIVNGQKMQVTENCRYALEQACTHYYRRSPYLIYFWIDSICIDQNSDMEKQHQVAMMGRIYSQAVRVLACVGRHQDNSEDLAEVLKYFKKWYNKLNRKLRMPQDALLRTDKDWFDECDCSTFKSVKQFVVNQHLGHRMIIFRFKESFADFMTRYYWTRLWIIQEVAVSKQLQILCGMDQFSRSHLYLLHWIAGCCIHTFPWRGLKCSATDARALYDRHDPSHFSHFKFVMSHNTNRLVPVLEVFSIRSPFGCSRPEDRVYGMLSLLSWPATDPPIRIEPVYKSSVNYDLAELFLSFPDCGFQSIVGIFRAFEICHDHERMQQLVATRSSAPSVPQDHSKYPVCRYTFNFWAIEYISQDYAGRLCIGHGTLRKDRRYPPTTLNSIDNAPQLLYAGSKIAALLCSEARRGDFLIPTTFGDVCLVIRGQSRSWSVFHIVGKALLINGFHFHVRHQDTRRGERPTEKHEAFVNSLFQTGVVTHASLLRERPEKYLQDVVRCFTDLSEIYADLEVKSPKGKRQSQSRTEKLGIIEELLYCTQEIFSLKSAKARLQPYVPGHEMPFILLLEPVEMMLLGCQDLEKDGSRNKEKMIQRLHTAVHGKVVSRKVFGYSATPPIQRLVEYAPQILEPAVRNSD